jgi:hypothetical protein
MGDVNIIGAVKELKPQHRKTFLHLSKRVGGIGSASDFLSEKLPDGKAVDDARRAFNLAKQKSDKTPESDLKIETLAKNLKTQEKAYHKDLIFHIYLATEDKGFIKAHPVGTGLMATGILGAFSGICVAIAADISNNFSTTLTALTISTTGLIVTALGSGAVFLKNIWRMNPIRLASSVEKLIYELNKTAGNPKIQPTEKGSE